MRVKAQKLLLSIKAPGACLAGSLLPRLTGEGFQQGLLRAQVSAILIK